MTAKELALFEDLKARIVELENAQEKIFSQHLALIGQKTSIIEIVTEVIAGEFSLNPLVFTNFQAYKIQIGKASNNRWFIEDKENLTQASYWLCSILHHWFHRSLGWLQTNYYWFKPYYVQRFKYIMIDAIDKDGTEAQQVIRRRYYRIMMEMKKRLCDKGIYNETYEPTFDLAESILS